MFGMTKDIGIVLGSANTLVYMRGKGIIIREPSVVAVDKKLQCVRYVGQEAKDVIGRTPGSIVAVRGAVHQEGSARQGQGARHHLHSVRSYRGRAPRR